MSIHALEQPLSSRFAGTVAVERATEENADIRIGLIGAAK